jgi:RNA polymerase sigma-B factor
MHVSRILKRAIAGLRERLENAESASPTLPLSRRRVAMAARDVAPARPAEASIAATSKRSVSGAGAVA